MDSICTGERVPRRAAECDDVPHARRRNCRWSGPKDRIPAWPPPNFGRCGLPPALLYRISHGDFEAVIGEADMRRKGALGPGVRQFVADMGEVGPARIELLGNSHGSLDGGMRRMRLMAQRIEKQHVQAPQLIERLLGDLAVVGEIGGGSEAVAEHLAPAVPEAKGANFQ